MECPSGTIYGRRPGYGATQTACDESFREKLRRRCQEARQNPRLQCPGFTLAKCNAIARWYANAVQWAGHIAFAKSQNAACTCLPDLCSFA